jgi:hypothetical protein
MACRGTALLFLKKSTKKRKPDGYLMRNQCKQIRTRIGSWNVRTLFQKGKLAQLNREMDRYKLNESGKHRWSDLRVIPGNREGWRRFVDNLCS